MSVLCFRCSTVLFLAAFLAALACASADASRTTDWLMGSPFNILRPGVSEPRRVFRVGTTSGAGSVVAYSPNVDEAAGPELRTKGTNGRLQCWIRVKVAVPIVGTRAGDLITLHFWQWVDPPAGSKGGYMDWGFGTVLSYARFTGGEKLIFFLAPPYHRYPSAPHAHLIASYDAPEVTAYREMARWDTLDGQAKMDAMAHAATSSPNVLLQRTAIIAVTEFGWSTRQREWAYGVLDKIVRGRASSLVKSAAVWEADVHLFRGDESGGVSGKVLDLNALLLNDPAVPTDQKSRVLDALQQRTYDENAVGPNGKKGVFREKGLKIIERFAAQTKDPELRKQATAFRNGLATDKAGARTVFPD